MKWFALLCFALLCSAFQSKHAFKTFYKEGEDLFGKGSYAEALARYKEAFRLEPKAQRYKEEGTFFRNYLPRYKIALCYEQLELAGAEEWVRKSKEAGEEQVIRRQRKEVAAYHGNMERILEAVATYRAELKARYDLKLKEADNLLARNKFEEARAAYQSLYRMDKDRTEAQVGLERIAPARSNYLKGKLLDSRTALLDKKFDEAEAILAHIAGIEADHPDLPVLRLQIRTARAEAERALTEPATKLPPKVTDTGTEVVGPKPKPTTPEARTAEEPATLDREAEQKEARARLRKALLATLKPYRRGDPEAALQRLDQVDDALITNSASYHWLKGLYTLGAYHYVLEGDEVLLDQARLAMLTAVKLLPDFEPDPTIYPDYVLNFFKKVTTEQNPE